MSTHREIEEALGLPATSNVIDTRYTYSWRNNSKRLTLLNRECRVIVRGSMNSALIEFEDGQREVISRNALRKSG